MLPASTTAPPPHFPLASHLLTLSSPSQLGWRLRAWPGLGCVVTPVPHLYWPVWWCCPSWSPMCPATPPWLESCLATPTTSLGESTSWTGSLLLCLGSPMMGWLQVSLSVLLTLYSVTLMKHSFSPHTLSHLPRSFVLGGSRWYPNCQWTSLHIWRQHVSVLSAVGKSYIIHWVLRWLHCEPLHRYVQCTCKNSHLWSKTSVLETFCLWSRTSCLWIWIPLPVLECLSAHLQTSSLGVHM